MSPPPPPPEEEVQAQEQFQEETHEQEDLPGWEEMQRYEDQIHALASQIHRSARAKMQSFDHLQESNRQLERDLRATLALQREYKGDINILNEIIESLSNQVIQMSDKLEVLEAELEMKDGEIAFKRI